MSTNHNDTTSSIPYLQLEFESEKQARDWYNDYAKGVGFSIRKEYGKRSKETGLLTNRRFVCYREGYRVKDKRTKNVRKPRKETRTGCQAHMTIALRSDGKYRVIDFESCHNHEVVDASIAHILPSQGHINNAQAHEIEFADNSGIRPELALELSGQVGGRENLGFLNRDQRNYLQTKRKNDLKCGEVGSILNYFENQLLENPSFFFAVQTDIEDQITNIFWADAKMIIDYSCLGDVIFFDTTYRTDKECRPFGAFVGLNHHYQQVVFGASLLYDETIDSFKWLLKTFLKCMSGKKPVTIFTDEDAIMANAIFIVMPETRHRLCLWHIRHNALKHMNNLFRDSELFMGDFNKRVYDCEDEEEFLNSWSIMLEKYNLGENYWLKGLFEAREKWAMVYGKEHFSAGKRSTQLCESFNFHLQNHLKSDLDVVQFFKHFERAVYDRRYKEKSANFDMIKRLPILKVNVPMLKHARDIYTPTMLDMFQDEYEKSLLGVVDACVNDGSMIEYRVCVDNLSNTLSLF